VTGGSRRARIGLTVAVLTLVVLGYTASAAHAGVLVSTAASCDTYRFEQPFLRWADPAQYVLAPNGGFERVARAWTLTGGARVVTGNESYRVHSPQDSLSLSLPHGSSATTSAMCVGIEHPTLRLFASNRGTITSTLSVEVLFEDATGAVRTLPIGLLVGTSAWTPTIQMPVVANLLPLLPGERTAVAFRFTPRDAAGKWRIDDVYVDPYRSR
jgi:hypothetical protein